MIKRLVQFMYDIEHYDSKFIYHPGHLQKVPDMLSHMPSLIEEGNPADTSYLYELIKAERIFDSICVIIPCCIRFYQQLHNYLKNDSSDVYKLKEDKI